MVRITWQHMLVQLKMCPLFQTAGLTSHVKMVFPSSQVITSSQSPTTELCRSFIFRMSRLWNQLPTEIFPLPSKSHLLKSRINGLKPQTDHHGAWALKTRCHREVVHDNIKKIVSSKLDVQNFECSNMSIFVALFCEKIISFAVV